MESSPIPVVGLRHDPSSTPGSSSNLALSQATLLNQSPARRDLITKSNIAIFAASGRRRATGALRRLATRLREAPLGQARHEGAARHTEELRRVRLVASALL